MSPSWSGTSVSLVVSRIASAPGWMHQTAEPARRFWVIDARLGASHWVTK
jgi:hypothetical protein